MSGVALRGLLFDLDGTLAHTDPLHYRAWRETLSPLGVDLREIDYQESISGRLNPDIVRAFVPTLSALEIARVSDEKEVTYRALATKLSPIRGLREILAEARARGLKIGLVTNAPRKNAEHVIDALGLQGVFEAVALGEEAERGKPDPAPYRLALERLTLHPDEAIAFEDSPAGIRSARGAGIRTVGIATSHSLQDLSAVGASLVVDDFAAAELTEWLWPDASPT